MLSFQTVFVLARYFRLLSTHKRQRTALRSIIVIVVSFCWLLLVGCRQLMLETT